MPAGRRQRLRGDKIEELENNLRNEGRWLPRIPATVNQTRQTLLRKNDHEIDIKVRLITVFEYEKVIWIWN
jgi:hypothetical protein